MLSKLFNITLSLGASLVVGLVALWTLEELQLKFALAFTLSLLVFCLTNLYTDYDKSFSLPLTRANIGVKIWLLSWFLAILLVISISPLETSSQFLVWNEIPVLILLRLIATFSLTTIYPGYALTILILRGRNLRFLEKTVFSILLSIFTSSTIAFVGILIEHSIGTLSLLILLSVNIFLLILTGYLARPNLFSKLRAHDGISINLSGIPRALLSSALITFVLLSVYSVNFPDNFVATIDQWYHYGSVLRALSGTLFSFVPGYYWLYMYEGLFISLTGLPFINAYMTLFVLCLLPILCFYLMCSGFWGTRKALIATTIYSLFSGFGGLYVNFLRLSESNNLISTISSAANQTYDISTGAVSFSFYLFPKIIGFSTLFTLIYLIYDHRLPRVGKIIFVSTIFALGYLTHVAEMIFFLLIATFLLLFSRKDVSNLKDSAHGLIIGLIIIAVIDLLAPTKNYGIYFLLTGHFEPVAAGLLGIVAFLCILPYLNLKLSSVGKFATKVVIRLSLPIVVVSIYLLTLSVIIWMFLYPTFSIGYTGGMFVWYLYPVRLGIALFMATFAAYHLFRIREFKILKLSLIIILISVGLERVFGYFIAENMTQFAFMSPVRMVEFTWIGIALLAAPVLISILKRTANTYYPKQKLSSIPKKFAPPVLLVIILIVGFSSTLYNVQIRSTPSNTLTDSELEALDFLRNETPSNVTVLALSYSANKITSFGGRYPLLYFQPAILGANTFEAFVDVTRHNTYELAGHFPLKYFWLANSDVGELANYEKGYFVSYLLNYLPVVYKNDEVTIFEIPYFCPPSQNSDLAVITNPSVTFEQENILEALALANLSYSIKPDFESFTSTNITQILPSDPHLHAQNASSYTIPENYISQETTIVFNSLGVKTQFNFSGLGPTVYETLSKTFLRTSYHYNSLENIVFYLDLSGAAKYNITGYPLAWRFMNITSSEELIDASLTDDNTFIYLNATLPDKTYRVYWTMNGLYQPVGWKEDVFRSGWSTVTNMPENGNMTTSPGDVLTVTFNASAKNVRHNFRLNVPDVDASQYRYLILKEKIDASSYNLGYLRCIIGGYTYTIRGWTSETTSLGHPWTTYVFDLDEAIAKKSEAPTPPEGPITQIFWTGYSTGENGGTAKLYIDYIILANHTLILPANITVINDFEDENEDRILYNGNFSKKLSRGEYYSVLENADYLGIALYGNGYVNGEMFNHEYWQYYWVKGNALNITSNGDCYIDKVVKVQINSMFEDRVLDEIENPLSSKFEDPFGVFATLLALDVSSVKQKQIVNGITGPGGNVSFPSIEVPIFYSNDAKVTPIAFYTKDGVQISPYVFFKKVGDQEIVYVQNYAYLEALQQEAGTDEGRELFSKLSALIEVLGLPLPNYQSPSDPMGRAILYGESTSIGNMTFHTESFFIPALVARLTDAIGWKDDAFQEGWSIDAIGNGTANANSDGDILQITLNATTKFNGYFNLQIPNVYVSNYHYLIFKEKIESESFMFGYLRLLIGDYIYCVRGWTTETKDAGHPWKTYVFDLYDAIPENTDAPTPPKGVINKIWWYGGSKDEKSGSTQLYLDYIILASSPIVPTNYGEITAVLDLLEANSVFIDDVPTTEKSFPNTRIFDIQVSGDFNSTFTSAEARLVPPGLGRYSKIAFDNGCDLTLWLHNASKISFITLIDGRPTNITVIGGKIHVNLISLKEELVAYLSDAQVSVNGHTEFEKAFISWPYGINNKNLPMEINGSITFKVNVMDQDFSLISELEIDGTYNVFTTQQVTWNEWDIPWMTVLASPYHILLVLAIAAMLVAYFIKRKYNFKIQNHLNYRGSLQS